MIFVALLFPCPCPFPLAKRCLNTFISPFHWLFLDRIGDLYTFKGFVHQLPHTKSWKPCSGIGNILSYSVIDVVRMLAIDEHCGTTLAPSPKPSISPMGSSGAIGQLAGCNLSLDLCAVKFFSVLLSGRSTLR